MNSNPLIPIILSGGSGSRLWPMSRTLRPKQFLGVTEERSLFQLTLARLQGLQEASLRPMVVANTDHRFLVAEQCRTSGVEPLAILLEPMARNTAPAIAAAAFAALALSSDQDPVLLVLPSDHTFANVPAFHQSVAVGIEAAKAGNLVTFGIVPTHPETGYGYVKAGQALNAKEAVPVDKFVEKPNLATAEGYLQEGGYYWNAGMFVVRASVLLDLLRETEPELVKTVEQLAEVWHSDARAEALSTLWPALHKVAIDYSVAEPAAARGLVAVVPATFAWRDLGDWAAVSDELGEPEKLTVIGSADVAAIDSTGLVLSTQNRPISVIGLEDVVVIDTEHGLLVTTKASAQGVKAASEHFSKPTASDKQAE